MEHYADRLLGIAAHLGGISLEQIREERLAKYIEPASPAECAKVERRVREYRKNPQSFIPLKSIK